MRLSCYCLVCCSFKKINIDNPKSFHLLVCWFRLQFFFCLLLIYFDGIQRNLFRLCHIIYNQQPKMNYSTFKCKKKKLINFQIPRFYDAIHPHLHLNWLSKSQIANRLRIIDINRLRTCFFFLSSLFSPRLARSLTCSFFRFRSIHKFIHSNFRCS